LNERTTRSAAEPLIKSGRPGLSDAGLVQMHTHHSGGSHWAVVSEEQPETPATLDSIQFHAAVGINGALQVPWNRRRAIIRMAGNADFITAETFDLIVPAHGLNIEK
jgi:hypothetical protein